MPRGRQVNMSVINAIGNALPADSYADIAIKVNLATGKSIGEQEIAGLISWIRKNRMVLGWWIPHCRRGRTMTGSKRLIMQLIEDGGSTFDDADHNDDDRRKDLLSGMFGTVQEAASKLRVTKHTCEHWREKPYVSPARKRLLRSMAIKVSHWEEELRVFAEDLLDAAA